MLFQSLAVQKVTTEPEYIATVLTLDDLQHPLLGGIHCNRDNDSGDFLLPPDEFSDGRQLMLDRTFLTVLPSSRNLRIEQTYSPISPLYFRTMTAKISPEAVCSMSNMCPCSSVL